MFICDKENQKYVKEMIAIPEIRDDLKKLVSSTETDKMLAYANAKYNLTYLNQGAVMGIGPFACVATVCTLSLAFLISDVYAKNNCEFTHKHRLDYYEKYEVPICYSTVEEARRTLNKELKKHK